LINRILGRKRARTANIPGVTRSLQWIRIKSDDKESNKEFELLDSPGIIPAKMVDQSDASLLAACNCIGQAAYDNQAVAAYLCEWIKAIHTIGREHVNAPQWRRKCVERYGIDPVKEDMTGEDVLFSVADRTCHGNAEDAARKILQDFRTGRMGPISLQLAPEKEEDNGQLQVPIGKTTTVASKQNDEWEEVQQHRARMAVETAKERGLELPPMVENPDKVNEGDEVGKGMFDGW
jgi:ribosome biogenesis GTPase A